MSTQRTVVSPGTSYPAQNAPSVAAQFEANFSIVTLESGAAATISFDGINDDIILTAGIVASVTLPLRLSKVWLKSAAATSVSVWQSSDATAH